MNESKLKQLLAAARNEPPTAPPDDFATRVQRAVDRESRPRPATPAFWDHLNAWFPRVALGAAAVIALCVAADWGLTAAGLPDLGDGAAQLSAQYLFDSEDL
jgi:anti-sigma-K factor RskA